MTSEYGLSWGASMKWTDSGNCDYTACDALVHYAGNVSGTFWAKVPNNYYLYIDNSLGGTRTEPLPVGTYKFWVDLYGGETQLERRCGGLQAARPHHESRATRDVGARHRRRLEPRAVRSCRLALAGSTSTSVSSYGLPFTGGTWNVTAVTRAGETVLEAEFPQQAGGMPVLNIYWSEVPEETVFDVSATFAATDPADGFVVGREHHLLHLAGRPGSRIRLPLRGAPPIPTTPQPSSRSGR